MIPVSFDTLFVDRSRGEEFHVGGIGLVALDLGLLVGVPVEITFDEGVRLPLEPGAVYWLPRPFTRFRVFNPLFVQDSRETEHRATLLVLQPGEYFDHSSGETVWSRQMPKDGISSRVQAHEVRRTGRGDDQVQSLFTPSKFVNGRFSTVGPNAVWTPGAGKSIGLQTLSLVVSGSCVRAALGETTFTLKVGNHIVQEWDVAIPAAAQAGELAVLYRDFGSGEGAPTEPQAQPDEVLTVTVSAGGITGGHYVVDASGVEF